MNKIKSFRDVFHPLLFLALATLSISTRAQQSESFSKNGFTLNLVNQDPNFNPKVKKGLVQTFFKVYPKLVDTFNPNALNALEVKIDTAYGGVAYAHNGKITISSEWLEKNLKIWM